MVDRDKASSQEEPRVSVFANGEEFRAFLQFNCEECVYYDAYEEPICEIDEAMGLGSLTDGRVPASIAERMGFKEGPPFRLGWHCPEKVLK